MSRFWKKVGKGIGQTAGGVLGGVGGAITAAGKVIDTGDWDAAKDEFVSGVKEGAEEVGEWGEDALPDVAKGIATAIAGAIVVKHTVNRDQTKKK